MTHPHPPTTPPNTHTEEKRKIKKKMGIQESCAIVIKDLTFSILFLQD